MLRGCSRQAALFREIEMKMKSLVVYLAVFSLVFLGLSANLFAQQVSVVGIVTPSFRIVAENGEFYYVTTKFVGNKLIAHSGKTVRVTGEIEQLDGEKAISVIEYQVLEQTYNRVGKQKTDNLKKNRESPHPPDN
jgi:hypothetical protein